MITYKVNPEKNQDRVFDTVDHFNKFGVVMFPEQRRIYYHLVAEIRGKSVIEAGCGNGMGTAMLEREAEAIIGTDKLQKNIDFAKELYPWINFYLWDINHTFSGKAQVVICVEAIEHVENPAQAIQHLIRSALDVVYISTPNGKGKSRPPENPYHVCEYTVDEMLEMIGDYKVRMRNAVTWCLEDGDTVADPLVYEILVSNGKASRSIV